MAKNNDEKGQFEYVVCPRCNYNNAELHEIVMADTGWVLDHTVICPNCQKEEENK